MDAFEDELAGFISRVEARAKVRIEEAVKEAEEEERQKRLGPGGLDPVEVMETLPQVRGGREWALCHMVKGKGGWGVRVDLVEVMETCHRWRHCQLQRLRERMEYKI